MRPSRLSKPGRNVVRAGRTWVLSSQVVVQWIVRLSDWVRLFAPTRSALPSESPDAEGPKSGNFSARKIERSVGDCGAPVSGLLGPNPTNVGFFPDPPPRTNPGLNCYKSPAPDFADRSKGEANPLRRGRKSRETA